MARDGKRPLPAASAIPNVTHTSPPPPKKSRTDGALALSRTSPRTESQATQREGCASEAVGAVVDNVRKEDNINRADEDTKAHSDDEGDDEDGKNEGDKDSEDSDKEGDSTAALSKHLNEKYATRPLPALEVFVKDGSNHPKAIPDIHVVHEDDFELAGNKKHHKKFHLSYTDFQQMEERDTPTEFAITCVRRWAQPLRFQPSITAKICSPVAKAKNKKGSNKAQFSQPGVKERDWKFHVLFLCGDAASQKEIKSSSNSGRFLSKAKSFY